MNRLALSLPIAAHSLRMAAGLGALPHRFTSPHRVPDDFIGINISSGTHPDYPAWLKETLADLGLRNLRADLGYDGFQNGECVLLRALADSHELLLRLLPPPEQAARLHQDEHARTEWREFLEKATDEIPATTIEIGATPNRRRWSGFTHRSYVAAWRIALEVAGARGLRLVGPGVSDFEPLHSIALLAAMRQAGGLPAVNTVNLFTERTREPEAWDERVLGRFMARPLKLNLIKKAAVFQRLGERFGISETWCTHTCWNAERVARWTDPDEVEQKRADYLVRYLLLVAAGGHLSRVYWGPLAGYPDGLVYNARKTTPGLERVARYPRLEGDPSKFEITPSYTAFKQLAEALPNSNLLNLEQDGEIPGWQLESTKDQEAQEWFWSRDQEGEQAALEPRPGNPIWRDALGREHPAAAPLSGSPQCAFYAPEHEGPVAQVDGRDP